MLLADVGDILWAHELPHKELIMTALYHLPGAMLLGIGCVVLRMLLEEVLRHISQKLSRLQLWTWLCVILWIVLLKTTPISDGFARKIHWDQIVTPPGQTASPGAAPTPVPMNLQVPGQRTTRDATSAPFGYPMPNGR